MTVPFITFKSNCTLPHQGVSFVSSPGVRGTLDIVWTSISILLLCTYSILHQNVPIQSNPRVSKDSDTGYKTVLKKITHLIESNRPKLWRFFFRILHKAGWVMLNLAAPELPFAKAWCDRKSARQIRKRFEGFVEEDKVEWSLTHIHVANMGGFMIKFVSEREETEPTPGPSAVENDKQAAMENDKQRNERASQDTTNQRREEQKISARSNLFSRLLGCTGCPQTDVEAGDHSSPPSHPTGQAMLDHIPNTKNYQRIIDILTGPDARKSLDGFKETVEDWSKWIGSTEWKPDNQNRKLVEEALESVKGYLKNNGQYKEYFESAWPSWYRNLRALQGNVWVLDAQQLLLARELKIISRLPQVARDDLNDRNAGDIPVMLVALCQIGWFVLQLLVRLCQSKPTSLLEIMSLSFAGITAVTYVLLWNKPKDMTCSIVFETSGRPTKAEDLIRLALVGPIALSPKRLTRAALIKRELHHEQQHGQRKESLHRQIARLLYRLTAPIRYANSLCISNFNIHLDHDPGSTSQPQPQHDSKRTTWLPSAVLRRSSITYFMATCSVALGGFGAVHLIAWEFAFPSPIESWLWRASSIATIATPVYAFLIHMYSSRKSSSETCSFFTRSTPKVLMYLGLAIYFFLARIFILAEAFRSLAFLDPRTFETSWPSNLPHVA